VCVCVLGLNWTAFLDLTVYYSVAVHLGRTTITDEKCGRVFFCWFYRLDEEM
jgi:hypothetical protein